MQANSSRIWTRVAVSISYNDHYYNPTAWYIYNEMVDFGESDKW